MVRLYLFVEGQTEQTFADTVLKLNLAYRQVYVEKIILVANAKKKKKMHRGGGRKYQPMKNDIIRFIKQEKATDIFFTTMIDLYAIYSDFPGLDESEKYRQDPLRRVEFLEQCFADDIGDRRFIPYLQLHEYEAYLFSDPSCFEYLDPERTTEIENLRAIANPYQTPEFINDGQQTAPSKRIIAQFPDYGRAKSTFGPQLAERIGLPKIREKCIHFNRWLSQLEGLNDRFKSP